MTQTHEVPIYTVEKNPEIIARVQRVRDALVELELARAELVLDDFTEKELSGAYVAARQSKIDRRAELDQTDRSQEDYAGSEEYQRLRAGWNADMDLEGILQEGIKTHIRTEVEGTKADYHKHLFGELHIMGLSNIYFDGRSAIED